MLLLNQGVQAAYSDNKPQARALFQQALELDKTNETALMWLAYLSSDAYEAVKMLETVVNRNPRNELAQAYLQQARARCNELEQLVSSSHTLSTWTRMNSGPAVPSSVPRLGEYLLKQGLITEQQLEMALRRHQDLNARGHRKMVGQVMIELGYITQSQLERWLQLQSGEYSNRFRD